MSFIYPIGLLGLIGIPVIIIIYILQSKYTEQTVNSTYIWHLSEKFMKRKNPLSGITGLISLLLQLLMVAVISLAIARPIFTLKNAAYDYCFILDTSSSMMTNEKGGTRMELAKDEIVDLINDAKDGSSYTLICVSNEATTIFEDLTDKKSAVSYVEKIDADQTHAKDEITLSVAQKAFDENTSSRLYFITDKSYSTHKNINVIDVGTPERENYSILGVTYEHYNGRLTTKANIISHLSNKAIELGLYIDGELKSTITQNVNRAEETEATIFADCESFSEFTVKIMNSDSYALDNEQSFYNVKSDKSYSVLIVSETGFFFKAVIDALVDSKIDIVDPDDYESVTEEYGLYIFDSYEPSTLPDGAVWLVNADSSIPNSGFSVRTKVEIPSGDIIQKSNSTATNVRKLLRGVSNDEIYITNYVKYSGMYLNFHTLYSYDSTPLIFAGSNGLGNRQVVFGFDLHSSDFALTTDFIILARNLLEYSFPDVVDETSYTVGDEALINIVANSSNFKVESPSGKDIYIDTDGATSTMLLEEVGTYTVSMMIAGRATIYKIYSSAHPEEGKLALNKDDFSLSGEATESKIDGRFDPIIILYSLIALLFIADWGVYLYEKYQLR